MGRPEPSVLFAQSFVHSQLDEYVDEVLFAEPIVISACEFLEQNASPSTSTVSLIGATSPPSFALEVFVHCEGESRFRRLCQPFLYSHSSSNVLEVEAVVTNHLVVRGSYRCLTLVVYGNTAEDLGQFNIEVDLDSSLANMVCSPSEGKLEDLPSALRSIRFAVEESISSLKSISLPVTKFDLSAELKEFLLLTLKFCQISDHEDVEYKILTSLVSAVSSYVASDHCGLSVTWDQNMHNSAESKGSQQFFLALAEARNELLEFFKFQKLALENEPSELLEEEILIEPNVELATSELLVYMFNQCFPLMAKTPVFDKLLLSQNKSMALRLGFVLLLCSARESCFRFVNVGGMEQITRILSHDVQKPTAIILMLLTIVEHATRHAIGCEGFLGWWPREDETLQIGNSDGYCHILRLLLQKQRHDVASLATYVLHRLRFYEIISRYESAVLSALGDLSADFGVTTDRLKSLVIANSQLKKVLKLLNMRGPIEDPSPMNFTRASLLGQVEGLLSYQATNKFIVSSNYGFATEDIDIHLLSLLKERGFLPLSAALLSSPILRSEKNYNSTMDILVEIAASIELILLSLLCCCSGLTFLLLQPEATATLVLSLQGVEDIDEAECLTLRHASVLVSKGFFCRPQDVGMITELHLRVGVAIDRLLTATPHSEEQLWLLWELCAISRSDCGRQALLAVGHFPKAVSVLMEALHSYKDLEPISIDSGTSPLSLAIFHSAAEIFEVIVTDSTASSLASWIGHAVELHKALHSSSPGSNRKDAPTRLLEWIDAGVVYHKNGAIGLLRYAAVLASGGDAHLTSTSILVSDSMDVENVVGDLASSSDSLVVDNLLGKLVSDKYFDGVTLRSTSIVQLTATFRILAYISENLAVATSLYEEGVVTLLYAVLINCKFMLERSSNTYDHLVDEGAECNSTSDLLMERIHEQSLVDLLIPSLVLLINILQSLHEAKEQYRNTKLLNALLQLHREISPKLVGFATEISSPYPVSALGLGAVCHLLTSALACWPVFGWTPGLFHRILESVQATSSLALGPKDACSLLCLLGDLFPDEGIWLWKNGMPSLSAIRTLSVGTLLGPQGERHVDWYLQAGHLKVLLGRLMPQLSKIAQIVLHFSCTALPVVQDMLRVFIIRIACQRAEFAVILLQPIISWMGDYINDASLSETSVFKVYRLLDFIASLLEHPCGKTLLLKEGIIGRLDEVLARCLDASNSDGKLVFESRVQGKNAIDILSWSIPTFKALALIFDPQTSTQPAGLFYKYSVENLSSSVTSSIGCHLLKLCQVLPVGRELLACLVAFKELASCSEGRSALASILLQTPSSSLDALEADGSGDEDKFPGEDDWRCCPFINCWKQLLRSLHAKDGASFFSIEAAHALSFGALGLCMEGKNLEGVAILKALFGLHHGPDGSVVFEEKLKDVHAFIILLDEMSNEIEYSASSNKFTMYQVKESVKSMVLLLQKAVGSLPKVEGVVSNEGSYPPDNDLASSENTAPQWSMASVSMNGLYDEGVPSFSHVWKSNTNTEKSGYNSFGGFVDKFMWECPDSPDRLTTPSLPVKRKLPSSEGSSRRARDTTGSEIMVPNVFSRGLGAPGTSSVPTRRDSFRQRKPNTSRPPSMHVDDYVARERNIDGVSSGSNVVIPSQRGSSSGRPPSIHVDEFMARQRERQNPIAMAVGNAAQIRDTPLKNENSPVKSERSRQLKADLDDDLHGIDIVFDEESESDDRLPFPQPDDNLQPAPLIIGESSPGSVVEETEGDTRDNTIEDGNSHSAYPLKSVSRPETSIDQDSNASSEKSHPWTNVSRSFFNEKSDESKYVTPIMGSKGVDIPPSTNHAVFPSHFYNASSTPSSVPSLDSWLPRASLYPRNSPQRGANVSLPSGSQKYYDQKFAVNQPPLPPFPPPIVSSLPSQIGEPAQSHSSPYVLSVSDVQPPIPSGYAQQAYDVHLHSEGQSPAGNSSMTSSTIGQPILDFKYSWTTASSGSRSSVETSSISIRPLPPLPPMPPPFSASPMAQSSATSLNTQSSSYNQNFQLPVSSIPLKDSRYGLFSSSGNGVTSYSIPPFTPSLVFSSPLSGPGTLFSSPTQQQVQNLPSLSPPMTGQPSIQSVQPRPPPPPPPPQTPRPQPPQHQRPPIQLSQPMSEQVVPLQQLQPLQVPQKLHIPQLHLYYQTQQQEQLPQPPQNLLEQAQSLNIHMQADNMSQQQQDSGMTLQQYFTSPEAIQSLLSDRDKLCQLLEQHPKLMQMLQERLGQL